MNPTDHDTTVEGVTGRLETSNAEPVSVNEESDASGTKLSAGGNEELSDKGGSRTSQLAKEVTVVSGNKESNPPTETDESAKEVSSRLQINKEAISGVETVSRKSKVPQTPPSEDVTLRKVDAERVANSHLRRKRNVGDSKVESVSKNLAASQAPQSDKVTEKQLATDRAANTISRMKGDAGEGEKKAKRKGKRDDAEQRLSTTFDEAVTTKGGEITTKRSGASQSSIFNESTSEKNADKGKY